MSDDNNNNDDNDASKIIFKPLILYFKQNCKPFEIKSFQVLAKISNLKHFWEVFNNINFEKYISVGSFFLSCSESPLWPGDGGNFSFIVSFKSLEFQKNIHYNNQQTIPLMDLSLALISLILNQPESIKLIEGVSIIKKSKTFNCKFGVSNCLNNEEIFKSFKSNLPDYFGDCKFMQNGERKKQINMYSIPPLFPKTKKNKKSKKLIKE